MITENKEKRITFRLTEEENRYLSVVAIMAGMKVSEYIRTMLNAVITAAKVSEAQGKFNLADFDKFINTKKE